MKEDLQLLPLKIQLFAGGEDSLEDDEEIDYGEPIKLTPEEDDEEEESETEETEKEAEPEKVEEDEESKKAKTKEVDTEAKQPETKKATDTEEEAEKKKAWLTEANKEFAQRRRDAEAKTKEAELKAHRKGLIEGLGGVNPFTNKKIEDDYDLDLYQQMKACSDEGGNPLTDLFDFQKKQYLKKQAEAEQNKTIEEKNKETIRNQIKEFSEKYPDVDLVSVLKNEEFQDLYGDVLQQIGPTKAYEKFLYQKSKEEARAKDIALKKEAKRQAEVGSLKNTEGGTDGFYSADELKKMSKVEIEKNWAKVERSYDRLNKAKK